MDLFDRVIHAMEGEGPARTWQTERGPVVVRRASFVDWAHRIERTYTPTALECVVLIKGAIDEFDLDKERRIVEGWSAALIAAASEGRVTPRDPVTLLPLADLPDDLGDWGVLLADADKFVADIGMPWTVTSLVEQLVEQANAALAREAHQLIGAREVVKKPVVHSKSEPDWKQIARTYATEAWDARREGSNPSKETIAEMVRKRFAAEGTGGVRGPLSRDTIVREALNIWKKPAGPRKSSGTP
ncbi:hypothetical protein H6CHR_03242 [Variovorax sp. PBL-H6]|uniref:hypothetical protein n=1 Tax=Variovorax sp. PBL-H6 TaxID=434009 RepID=UPI0013194EC4|nr:hypothetical protein [Variovorax sp. PBL-H6]VTU29676.1 hypothetical protein H6CHR_03242 [Variovorax sp. PBL-H6]